MNETAIKRIGQLVCGAVYGRLGLPFFRSLFYVSLILAFVVPLFSQNVYENRRIDAIHVDFDGSTADPPGSDVFRKQIKSKIGDIYSATRIHDSIDALYAGGKVSSVTVAANLKGSDIVELTYHIRRKLQAEKVSIVLGKASGDTVTEADLLFKLNLLAPGTLISDQTLQKSASEILIYLREHGYFRSEVTFATKPLQKENEVEVVFTVTPNEQAKVERFNINIEGLGEPIPPDELQLQAGEPYSKDRQTKDVEKVREILRERDFVAPDLDESVSTYDPVKNTVLVELNGKVGPVVKVEVESEKVKIGDRLQTKLIPLKREGTLDYAAIIEGERRIENYLQEDGYFFAKVTPICSVDPPLTDIDKDAPPNNTEFLCSTLGSSELDKRTVSVKYVVDQNRRLKLKSIRIRGTKELDIEDIRTVLESQEASAWGVVPVLGYGRGLTSLAILDRDSATVRSLMNELGYREAQVHVNQGVSPNGEDLIITFEVEQGVPTVVSEVEITGNAAFSSSTLLTKIASIAGRNYSRARVKNAVRTLSEFYSKAGYYDAHITSSIEDQPAPADATERSVKVLFKVEDEHTRVVVNRVLVTGNEMTKVSAIIGAATLRSGEFLTAADIYSTEQNLYATDAFDRVEIKTEPAGINPDGSRLSDVIINVKEQPPRLATYGGGYSTDLGANGFFDIRHVNLFGNLWQGGARIRWSQRQQLVQFDFVQPRFLHDGDKRFTPLTISAQFQRDSTVTRFFRSAFDKGTFGIVQRIDPHGNPIDEFGRNAGDPTINRFSISAETSRTISRKNRSIFFARFRYEDVLLANIESLLIRDLLRPDSRVRISGFGFTFVRDTRQNCSAKYSLLEQIAKGEPGDPCRYNASDPTRGNYLTAEYNVSIPQLGANIGFHKFQASYNTYYTFPVLHNTTLAARAIVGLASVFSSANRFTDPQLADLNGILPISERFFAGGPNTLRGFAFEEAGPRVVIVPQGTFINSSGKSVYLDPFTIPFGGNALAVVNIEARIPISKSIRVVPFYDGGNVFRRVGDIFHPPTVPANDVLRQNLRALWTHTTGLGLRLRTPIGGDFGVDYGFLLNPPRFQIPQPVGPNAIYQLHSSQLHFHFSQAF